MPSTGYSVESPESVLPSTHVPRVERAARRSGPARLLRWALGSWAIRSLAAGGVATFLDIAVLLFCVKLLHFPNPLGAALGVLVGSIFTFFANKHFAFKDRHPERGQALRYAATTAVAMGVHALLIYVMANLWNIPVVVAKMAADLLVFSVGQLLLLRYVVFPKQKGPASETPEG